MSNDFPRMGINTEELRTEVERLIEQASLAKEEMGAVNWGDLGIADIEYRLSMLWPDRGPRCVVTVEEAAPDCELQRWLNRNLDRDKFLNTWVECEW